MSISWRDYDHFDWANSQQSPMDESERDAVAKFAADVLELAPADRTGGWGFASPPGRFAATVIQLAPGLAHRYRDRAEAAGISALGVKVFKPTDDAAREAKRVVPFHRTQANKLPGLPNPHLQKSLDAGTRRDRRGEERAFIVQEWVEGDSLEDLLRRREPGTHLPGEVVRSIIDQLLGSIVIPLWARGTIWWDFRDANYCYSSASGRLMLIDLDSLSAYAEEILETPQVWERRDKGRGTALARLRQMSTRLLLARGLRGKKAIETACAEAWADELEGALRELGKDDGSEAKAREGLTRFLQRCAG